MKIRFILAVAALVSLVSWSCGKSDTPGPKDPNKPDETMSGWVLQSWNGSTELAGKVYLSLAGGSFTLYQLVDVLGFQRFLGTYTISDGIISGVYDDKKPWAEKYEISGEDTQTMTLTGVESRAVSVYGYTTIPDYVQDNVTISSSRGRESSGVDDDVRFL